MISAPRYHRCCSTVQAEYLVASIASVFLLATIGSPAPRSLALIILLTLIIASSFVAAIVDWRADASFQGSIHAREQEYVEDIENGSRYLKMDDSCNKKGAKPADEEKFIKQIDAGLRPRRHVVVIMFSSGISLFVLLMIRLVAGALHFRGYPPLLDFGPKYGDPSDDAESNIAFENEFNSYGHCIQGILSSLLAFPAVAGALARATVCGGESKGILYSVPRVRIIALVEATAAMMTFYPGYNFLKRAILHPDTFATSSFTNNGMEWAMGFILGLSFGMLASAVIRKKLVSGYLLNPAFTKKQLIFRKNYDKALVYGKYDEYPVSECSVWMIFAVQMILGFFFTFSVYGSAIFTGHTWNRCEDNSNECLNFDADLAPASLRFGLIGIPAVVFLSTVMATHGF